MQQALTEMNLKLHTVLTDLTGQTGRRIVRSILDRARDPERLAAFRDYRCSASPAEIVAALTGNYRAEHRFALRQNFAVYAFLLKQIAECDGAIEALLTTLSAQQPPPSTSLPVARRKRVSKLQPQFEIRGPLHRLTGGTDLSQINSIGPQAALQIVAEFATDSRRWENRKALYLVAGAGTRQQDLGRTPARFQDTTLRQSSRRHPASVRNESHSYRDRTRRLLSTLGRAHWHGPSPHCHCPQTGRPDLPGAVRRPHHNDSGATAYHQLNRSRELKSLRRRANLLALELLDRSTGELLVNPVP